MRGFVCVGSEVIKCGDGQGWRRDNVMRLVAVYAASLWNGKTPFALQNMIV